MEREGWRIRLSPAEEEEDGGGALFWWWWWWREDRWRERVGAAPSPEPESVILLLLLLKVWRMSESSMSSSSTQAEAEADEGIAIASLSLSLSLFEPFFTLTSPHHLPLNLLFSSPSSSSEPFFPLIPLLHVRPLHLHLHLHLLLYLYVHSPFLNYVQVQWRLLLLLLPLNLFILLLLLLIHSNLTLTSSSPHLSFMTSPSPRLSLRFLKLNDGSKPLVAIAHHVSRLSILSFLRILFIIIHAAWNLRFDGCKGNSASAVRKAFWHKKLLYCITFRNWKLREWEFAALRIIDSSVTARFLFFTIIWNAGSWLPWTESKIEIHIYAKF